MIINNINPIEEDENEENTSINIDGNSKATKETSIKLLPLPKDENIDNEKAQEKIPEREIDDIVDLKDKFRSILMKINVEDGEDCLIYGMQANLLTDNHKIKQGIIYSSDERFLTFVSPQSKNNQIRFKINLSSISDMTIGKSDGNLKSLTWPLPDDCCLTIHYSSNLKHYDIIFKDSIQLELFVTGIISILQKRAMEGNYYDTDLLSLKRIWKEYDPEHNKFLNVEQFSNFLKNINFDFKNKSPEKIFQEIDTKNENKIKFKDFISFYELLVTGEEFREVFQKYSSAPNKSYLSIKGLVDFMEKEQHETLSQEEALKLVCKYSKKAKKLESRGLNGLKYLKEKKALKNKSNKSLSLENTESMLQEYENHSFGKNENRQPPDVTGVENALKNAFQLSFREFVNLIIDKQNNIYDPREFVHHQNMNLPLTDYYCHSSHNTYLTGNQITSESSVEMYSYVLKNGCRFLDLDTFDGREGDKAEPIITHWHFPVGDISFKDALIVIKEHAFIKSEYPVILSLENHCTAASQERMEKYFLEILGRENIYIIDPENPPLIYPSPNELKKKFIIKNKGKRIFGNLTEMKINYHKLFVSIMNENKKKLENQTNLDNGTMNNQLVSPNTISNNLSPIKNDNNQLNTPTSLSDKKATIINRVAAKEVIEEENISNKSMDSDIDEGNIEINMSNLPNENTFKMIKDIPNNNYIIPTNHFEIEYKGKENDKLEYKQAQPLRKAKKKKSFTESKIDKFALPTFSSSVLQKLKQKYIIENGLYSISDSIHEEITKKDQILSKIEEIRIHDSNSAHHVHIITIDRLANILGMVGVKYHKETFDPTKFLPWECISIAEPDVLKYTSTFEGKCKMIEYCQKSFLKIYPDTFRTNSSNQNPIMCWALGCQFAALNLQTTNDDFVLLNKMFFKVNGGSKCGYVLKPQSLREFNRNNFRKMTLKPVYRIKFKILSGFHLHLCCPKKEKITGMFIEVSLRTPNNNYEKEGEKQVESKLVTSIISKNFLHPIWESNNVVFDIYEPELSFIVVKLYSRKREHTLAKGIIPVRAMSLGYRVLELYDNECSKFDESYLIVRTNKIFS